MGYVNPGMSLAQNIDNMFFKKNAILRDEYNRLFASVFVNPEAVKKLYSYCLQEMLDLPERRLWKNLK